MNKKELEEIKNKANNPPYSLFFQPKKCLKWAFEMGCISERLEEGFDFEGKIEDIKIYDYVKKY